MKDALQTVLSNSLALIVLQSDALRFDLLQVVLPPDPTDSSLYVTKALSDLNGDGYGEIAVTKIGNFPLMERATVYVLSGSDRTVISRFSPDPSHKYFEIFGYYVA